MPTRTIISFFFSICTCAQVALALALIVAAALPASAAKTIYRCEKNGQIALTDKPCDGPSSQENGTGTTVSSLSDPSTVGKWRGQIQYHGTEAGEVLTSSVIIRSIPFPP